MLDIEWFKIKRLCSSVTVHEIALAKLVVCMEDLRKTDFISIQIDIQTSQSCTRISLNCLELFLKVRYTLQGSNTCFYLYFQISKLTHKASLKLEKFSFFSPFLFHAICPKVLVLKLSLISPCEYFKIRYPKAAAHVAVDFSVGTV